MFQILRRNLFGCLKMIIYGHWPTRDRLMDGYTMLIPVPGDMPFLLRFALEGLRHLRMPNCKQIVVISDGAGSDRVLQAIIAARGDNRIRFAPLTWVDHLLVKLPRSDNSANYRHFTQILRGVLAATTDAIYLHDADAFWLEDDGVESQYREFREQGMYTLGVTSRIDPMFKSQGMTIPGTWELMFSKAWVRQRAPVQMKGGWYPMADGEWQWFDTLLYGQYVDYITGRIGVMAKPPRFVHFYGAIVEYRRWQRASQSHEDELFSLLLLSVLSEAIPGARQNTRLPHPNELSRGLQDATAKVTYVAESAPKRYASFRRGISELSSGPVFANDVSRRIHELLAPFDEHFGVGREVSLQRR